MQYLIATGCTTTVCVEGGLRGEVREHGKIPNTPAALQALTV